MTPYEAVVLVAVIAYALYRQSRRHEVVGATRFKLAIIYLAIGLVMGGYHVPHTAVGIGMLVGSLVVSAVVGLARGRLTRLWREGDAVLAQGTAASIGLFVALVAVKIAIGTVTYLSGAADTSGLGEILVMIGVMVAFQAEIIWRRAKPLGARSGEHAAPVTVS